jgi:hypothetical protein
MKWRLAVIASPADAAEQWVDDQRFDHSRARRGQARPAAAGVFGGKQVLPAAA